MLTIFGFNLNQNTPHSFLEFPRNVNGVIYARQPYIKPQNDAHPFEIYMEKN